MEKWEDFLSRAIRGKISGKVKEALMAIPQDYRDGIEVIVEAAVEFGGMSEEEISEKYN